MTRTCLSCLLPAILLAGCVSISQGLDPDLAASIPQGASAIRLYSSEPPDDYYTYLSRALIDQGYVITQSDPTLRVLTTDYREVGQATTLSITVAVDPHEEGSVATLRGRWGVTGSFAAGLGASVGASISPEVGETAIWKKYNRGGVAFGAMAALARTLQHTAMEYVTD
ncbi:MAG: hypothetical protein KatS3mg051_2091 [Anaerolineae bacterium]|nr:MAG: hypothetical protein KatS3mg051_2091 [Anaerolineae bacterium]